MQNLEFSAQGIARLTQRSEKHAVSHKQLLSLQKQTKSTILSKIHFHTVRKSHKGVSEAKAWHEDIPPALPARRSIVPLAKIEP